VEELEKERAIFLDAHRGLNEAGVSDKEILDIYEVIRGQEKDIPAFKREVARLGGLKGYVEEKTAEANKLDARLEELNQLLSDKESRISALDMVMAGKLSSYQVQIAATLKQIESAVTTFTKGIDNTVSGLKEGILTNITEVSGQVKGLLRRQGDELTKEMLEFRQNLRNIVGETEKVRDSAYRAGEVMGKYSNLKPLLSIYLGESVDASQVGVSVIAMLEALSKWLERQGYRRSRMGCDQLKETLRNEWLAFAG
jgi:chromosome segregation ATPase